MNARATQETREFPRFQVHAAVFFSWNSDASKSDQGEGLTRDFCIRGMFVETTACPPENAVIRFEAQLPRLDGERPTLKIEAAGRVTRVEFSDVTRRTTGFAVESEQFLLVDPSRDLIVRESQRNR